MPTAAIVLLCVAGFICLLLIARVHLTVTWRERVRVRVRYLFIVFPIIPKKVRWRRYTAKRAEKERRKAEKHKAEHKADQKEKNGENRRICENLRDFSRKSVDNTPLCIYYSEAPEKVGLYA